METGSLKSGQRDLWLAGEDKVLLGQCEVDTYRASGPGGQKRNKTSSAVRLRHLPSSTIVIAEESRSQHENKAKALKRLRRDICLRLREEIIPTEPIRPPAALAPLISPTGISIGPRHELFFPLAGWVLDLLEAREGRVAEVAVVLGTSTAQTVDFLQSEPNLWKEANRMRKRLGHPPLR
jgi:hypothetical protein